MQNFQEKMKISLRTMKKWRVAVPATLETEAFPPPEATGSWANHHSHLLSHKERVEAVDIAQPIEYLPSIQEVLGLMPRAP